MPEHDEHVNGSSSRQPEPQAAAARGSGEHTAGAAHRASSAPAAKTAAARSETEGVTLSRRWGGAGATVNISIVGQNLRVLEDWRVLWGFHHGGDGYTLLQVAHTEGHPHSITFTVPATSTPGLYVIQLEHGNHYRRRVPFIVTPHDPPAGSPFRILRTDPAPGTMRMYQVVCKYRSTPPQAAAQITEMLKGYDTFFDPIPDDPKFQEILEPTQTPYDKRKKFATWLVKNQLAAEETE